MNRMSLPVMPAKLLKLWDDQLALESPGDEHGAVGDGEAELEEVELHCGQGILSKHLFPSLKNDRRPEKVSNLKASRKNLLRRRRISMIGFILASSLVIPIFSSSQRSTPAFAVWASSFSLQNLNNSSSNFLAVGLGRNLTKYFPKRSYSSFPDPELLLLRVVGVVMVGSHSARFPKSQLLSDSLLLRRMSCLGNAEELTSFSFLPAPLLPQNCRAAVCLHLLQENTPWRVPQLRLCQLM